MAPLLTLLLLQLLLAEGLKLLPTPNTEPAQPLNSPVYAATATPPVSPPAYDYLQLVVQWPPSVCYRSSPACSSVHTFFSIHGLWPERNDGKPFVCPTSPKFNISLIPSALRNQLAADWPNLRGPNANFWEHEWVEHGTCTKFTQAQYFQKTVDKFRTLPSIALAFTQRGINRGSQYSINNYQQAIYSTGWIANVACSNISGQKILLEIRFCLDGTGGQLQNCTWKVTANCLGAGKILYP